MSLRAFNFGCGLIATAPVFAAHWGFLGESRYIVLAWFSSFISTVVLALASISSLFTSNPWGILGWSVPLDAIAKAVVIYFAAQPRRILPPHPGVRIRLGLCCGLGFALAHVLTVYIPIVFDQATSVDLDDRHSMWFPNSLDLALVYNFISVWHLASCLLFVRFIKFGVILVGAVQAVAQFVLSAISLIPIVWLKLLFMAVLCYGSLIFGIYSYRTLEYQQLEYRDVEVSALPLVDKSHSD
jgi:hypothetical protein